MPGQATTKWDKTSILMQPLGGFLTAVAVAFVGIWGSNALSRGQAEDARHRAYVELLNQRATADSSLRKDMFQSILNKFLQPQGANLDQQLLQLEMLAYNFHDTLDLSSLFKDVYRRIDSGTPAGRKQLKRLEKIVLDVNDRESAALASEGGNIIDGYVDFEQLHKAPEGVHVIDEAFGLRPGCEKATEEDLRCRRFIVDVMDVDTAARELLVRLEVFPPGRPDVRPDADALFHVGFFDFPMIDNTRLSHNQRCAVVLRRFDDADAVISLLYFPGFRTGLMEKVYIEEVLHEMTRAPEGAGGR